MLNEEVSRVLEAHRHALARGIVARHYEVEPENWQAYGTPGRERCVQDARYHLMYLAEAVGASSPAIFTDYASWLRVLFAGLGFPEGTVAFTLETMRDVIRRALPPPLSGVTDEYLDCAQARLRRAPVASASFIQPSNRLAPLAHRYLEAMLRAERDAAIQLVVKAAKDGVPVSDLYLSVVQPVQHEIGRLWQTNRISVAQEHYCTAATQLAMAQLYPYIFSTPKSGLRLVVACVSGELHEIGPRMLADLFELDGWDTYYLGANTPVEAILATIEGRRPHLLAVSATIAFHMSSVADLIGRVRAAATYPVRIMVGGYPFNVDPDLWQRIGADGSARDAREAIMAAKQIVGQTQP